MKEEKDESIIIIMFMKSKLTPGAPNGMTLASRPICPEPMVGESHRPDVRSDCEQWRSLSSLPKAGLLQFSPPLAPAQGSHRSPWHSNIEFEFKPTHNR